MISCKHPVPRIVYPETVLADGPVPQYIRSSPSPSSSGRVTKPVATPRNMFNMNRSPSYSGPASSLAPPTPDTPLVASQTGMGEMGMTSAFGMDSKLALANHDPTLTTPPSTPGLVDGLFNINSAYGMHMSDDGIVNTGLNGLPSGFEMANMPSFVGNGSSGQSQSSMYNSRQAYMPFYGNGCDWSNNE